MQNAFEKFGRIADIRIPTYEDSNKKRGYAFIVFEDLCAAQAALKMNGTKLDGRTITVRFSLKSKIARQSNMADLVN